MTKILTAFALIAICSTGMAQDTKEYTVLDGSTSATRATSAPASMSTEAALTTASSIMARQFSEENFAKRWKIDEASYKKAGLSQEKIDKLRAMDERTWKARAAGEKLDFAKLSRDRAEILSPEESKKLRDVRREMMNSQLKPAANSATTGSL